VQGAHDGCWRFGEVSMVRVIEMGDLPLDGTSREFEGYLHGGAGVSLILVEARPGGGPRLHRHPYEEVFVVQEGRATFTVGDDTVEASGGHILVVPAGVPHRFVNSGDGPLRQVDIHASDRFVTEWLEG
jgi:mannose-6-phosphate isomerase-like protein (cupin superfamily)